MTYVKICGLTNLDDMFCAVDAGADLIGFIFYPPSPRNVTREQVAGLMEALRGYDATRIPMAVAVFVNPSVDEVAKTIEECGLQAAQIHKAPMETLRQMRERTRGSVYAAIQPRTVDEAQPYLDLEARDGVEGIAPWLPQLLVDAYHPDLLGGTGKQANLDLGRELAAQLPRLMLAGSLTPDNVATAIQTTRPWAVDVSSGVEATPGKKDHAKIMAFIQAARGAF